MSRRILTAALVIAFAAPARADDATPAAPVKVPFEMLTKGRLLSGHLAVQVKVNGKGPYRLVFDTGAPMILLSNRVAREAGLLAGDKRPARPIGIGFPGQVQVKKIEVGDLAAENLNAIVLDHPTVSAIAEVFGQIDGIIGFPFFARYRTAIDYQAKELTFTPNGYKPADVMQTLMTTLMTATAGRRGKEAMAPRVLAPSAQWGLRVEKAEDDEDPGVMVKGVFAGSAAAKAGVQPGDRLMTLDGRWTDTVNDCYLAAEAVKAGQAAELALKRGGKEIKLTVTPAAGL
jgi:hypothetical protein